MQILVDKVDSFYGENTVKNYIEEQANYIKRLILNDDDVDNCGWREPDKWAGNELMQKMQLKSLEILKNANVFIVVGLGGSNRTTQALISALNKKFNGSLEIIFAGDSLSGNAINKIINQIKDKSIYINVVAKNATTLEPAIAFRMIRQFMETKYSKDELSRRIILTGSHGKGQLKELAIDMNCTFFEFPYDIGGRFTAFTSVSLFPLMVMGVDVKSFVQGAINTRESMKNTSITEIPAVLYAAARMICYNNGKKIEIAATFVPELVDLLRWWLQLFGESEGKEFKGIFPSICSYSEDLHAMGQYVQQGERILFETLIKFDFDCATTIKKDEYDDGIDYLNGKSFIDIENALYQSTLKAHFDGGVPVIEIDCGKLNEYNLGRLIYTFLTATIISGSLTGVNPYGQPGVEEYKNNIANMLTI